MDSKERQIVCGAKGGETDKDFDEFKRDHQERVFSLQMKKNKREKVVETINWLRKSYITGVVIVIDIIMNLILCGFSIIDTYMDKTTQTIKLLMFTELIVNCYLLLSWVYEFIVSLHIKRFMLPISFITLIVTFIPLVYYLITGDTMFKNWKNHSHVYSLCFIRIIYVDYLVSEALCYFWIGENNRLFNLADKLVSTFVSLISMLYFSSSVFHFLEGYNEDSPYHYFHNCFYYCVVTISTVGYGDMTPQTWYGRLFCALYILSFLIYFPLKLGQIFTALNERGQSKLFYANNHVMYTGDPMLLSLFPKKVKSDFVALLPKTEVTMMSKRKYERYYYCGDALNEDDLKQSNTKKAKRVILTTFGGDKRTFLRMESIKKQCTGKIFCLLENDTLQETFESYGVECISKQDYLMTLVNEILCGGIMKILGNLFSVKTRKNEIQIIRSLKVPNTFVGKNVSLLTMEMLREMNVVVVGIKKREKILYFGSNEKIEDEDLLFVLSRYKEYLTLKTQIKSTQEVVSDELELIETSDAKRMTQENENKQRKVKKMKEVVIQKYDGCNHYVFVGYFEGCSYLIQRIREVIEDDIVIVIGDERELKNEWKELSAITKLYVIEGDLNLKNLYYRANVKRAECVTILPNTRKGDDCDVVVNAKKVRGVINEIEIESLEIQKDVRMVCYLDNLDNARYVEHFSSVFCMKNIAEMICNMSEYDHNEEVWKDINGITKEFRLEKYKVPTRMVGSSLYQVFEFLMDRDTKCLGIVKERYGKIEMITKSSYELEENDELCCIAKKENQRLLDKSVSFSGIALHSLGKMSHIQHAIKIGQDTTVTPSLQTTKNTSMLK
ncbi:hypothetical protein EIN_172370 [Entamoeba invadens IP1]|uniref:Potassium channel domain-containing protein n=1 Tax=Entamoeba invadens IP1 TaxID=370355 RepID=A0A0A1TVU8_ENTIV|nr:hypothetical protein EIN_172370 [Entamoeba invadens IP1]ELP84612.1 hypothetical protein EIN_172370 [Entamoeba invadens IP1]|eukprot:XP_004183958.1 hypothetical protein EIN_172370 [Entamoeba invadens IP1]